MKKRLIKKRVTSQKLLLDSALESYYSHGTEINRLSNAVLEKDRTLRILKTKLPAPPATILDVGGAYGIYSYALTSQGYDVHLIDPIPLHIEQAIKYGVNFPSTKLISASIGDARKINWPNNSVDTVLFLGPMYHLLKQKDRVNALKEAYRILKPGGMIFASSISRFQSLIDNMNKGTIYSKIKAVEIDLQTGLHWSENSKMSLYFHHPKEIRNELKKTRFNNISLLGIEVECSPFKQDHLTCS